VATALQHGKVENLRRAIARLDGILIRPGEMFSFCRLVGRPTRSRGFVEGVELARGVPRAGIGGGLCQLANMIHWLTLHSELTIIERHGHSFDPFPDDGRVLPFGSGATIFYNYLDYRVVNRTADVLQLRLWLTANQLNGDLRASAMPPVAHRVYGRNERFIEVGRTLLRENELWREVRNRDTIGRVIRNEFLYTQRAEVKYPDPRPA
jgi:vancomycin resistance protein VanW